MEDTNTQLEVQLDRQMPGSDVGPKEDLALRRNGETRRDVRVGLVDENADEVDAVDEAGRGKLQLAVGGAR